MNAAARQAAISKLLPSHPLKSFGVFVVNAIGFFKSGAILVFVFYKSPQRFLLKTFSKIKYFLENVFRIFDVVWDLAAIGCDTGFLFSGFAHLVDLVGIFGNRFQKTENDFIFLENDFIFSGL